MAGIRAVERFIAEREVGHDIALDRGLEQRPLKPGRVAEVAGADLSAFLQSRVAAASNRGAYKILDIVTGDAKAGEAYFNGAGGCSGCHSVTGDFKGIGAKYDPPTLLARFLSPRGGRGGRAG